MRSIFCFALILVLTFSLAAAILLADPEGPFIATLDSTKGAKINVYYYESTSDGIKDKPVLLVHGFNSKGNIWEKGEIDYVAELSANGYDVIVVDMRGNAVDTDGDHKTDIPVVGDSWGYNVRDLGDDVGTALTQGLEYLNKNLPGRNYKNADVITHSTGALAVTSYSRSLGLIPYRNNIDTIIELAPPNNGSTSLVANIKETAQIIPSLFTQSMIAYEYALDLFGAKVWIPGGRMESENLRKELMPESLFLKSIKNLGPDPEIKTFIAMGDEDWVVGDWSPVVEERDDIGYEYFVGIDHFNFTDSELVIAALLDKLEKGEESSFFNRYKPYRNKTLLAFLSGPGIDHPDDTFDVVNFAKGIDISPSGLFDLYMRIAARKNKKYLLKYWEGILLFEKAQQEILDGESEANIINKWQEVLSEKNASFHEYHAFASREYLECPDIAILANGYYTELTKLIIEKVREPVRLIDHTFNPSILNEQKLLLIPSGGLSGLSHSTIFRKKLSEYVKNGGTIICFSQQNGYDFDALPTGGLKGYGWQEDTSCHSKAAYIEDFHQVLSSQDELYPDIKLDGYFTDYPGATKIILRRTKNLMPAMLMYKFGNGIVIAASIYSDWGYSNGQTSMTEISLIRDLIRWAKGSNDLPEYNIDKNFRTEISTDKDFHKIEMILKSPEGDILEKKTSTEPLYELGRTLNKPGIYCVDYILYDSDSKIIQPQTEGFYFSFSTPPEGSVEDPNFTFDITTDSEHYVPGSKVKFSFHIKNNTEKDELVKYKATLTHHDIQFRESIEVPANSLISFDKTVTVAKASRLVANFYSSGNNFLGRAERGINVFEPSVEINLDTNKSQYTPGQTVLINSSIVNTSKLNLDLSLVLNIVDSNVREVYYETKIVKLGVEETYSWKHDYRIPEEATRGRYKIKLNAFSNSRLAGSSSMNIDIPGPLVFDQGNLSDDFSELLDIKMEKPVYRPNEPISADVIINNKGEKIDSAILDIRVLPDVEKGYLSGAIKDADGNPIKGAAIGNVYTNNNGRYRLERLNRGKYILNIRAPGYDRFSKEIDILAGDNNLDVSLGATKYGNLSGVLEGSIGSDLTLNPVNAAGSDAATRKAVVSAASNFDFKHIPVGSYLLDIQPENISKAVQIIEGDNVIVDRLEQHSSSGDEETKKDKTKNSNKKIEEDEPNDDFEDATELNAGTTMHGKIYDYGDEDYFKISVDTASILKISLKDVADGLRPYIRIYDSKLKWIGSTAAFSGEAIDYSLEIPEGGTYYLQLKDRYNTYSSDKEYSLTLDLVHGEDKYEPNPDFKTAKKIDIRKEVICTMFPKGDQDYFLIDIEKKGIFYIKMQNVPEDFRPSLKIYDSSGKLISQKGGASGEEIGLETEIEGPGQHYLFIKDWYSSFSSIETYSFKTYFMDTLDGYEPNDSREEAHPVDFGTNYFATISIKGDSDFYGLSVPDAGKIVIFLKDVPPNVRPYIKLYRAPRAQWIDSTAGFAGENLTMELEADNPSNYIIQVQDRYNSESSLLRYRLLAIYVPHDEYLSGDASIFKQKIDISNITHTKTIEIRVPGIGDTGKYYLQAALNSLIPQKKSQAVERFYVSDADIPTEPIAQPEISVLYLEDGGAVFTAGEKARFKFKAKNMGGAGGRCKIDFRFMDLFSHSMYEFLEPGAEKELQFEFLLPMDLEDGLYKAEYLFSGERREISFKVSGVKLEVRTAYNYNIFNIKLKNIGSARNVNLSAEVRCGRFEDKRDFTLMETEELVFNIPDVSGQEKIYYGIYFDSGKALYLDSFLLNGEEARHIPIKVVEAKADKSTYEDGDQVILEWKVRAEDAYPAELSAELIGPDSFSAKIIEEVLDLKKGINILKKEINPRLAQPGLYRILYRFTYSESIIAQGSIFFDVEEEVKLDIRLDKNEYIEGENIKLTADIFSSFSLRGRLKILIDDSAAKAMNINLEDYKEIDFAIGGDKAGRHRIYAILSYDNKKIESEKENFIILPKPQPNHSPVLFTIGEKSAVVGEDLEFLVDGMDIDGDSLTYSAESLPTGATFEATKKKFSWRPGQAQTGEHFITFTVSDGKDSAVEKIKIVVKKSPPPSPGPAPLAVPVKGTAPLEVKFSAASVSNSGEIVKYQWDFDGKGVYDFSSTESADTAFVYIGEGSFPAVLAITDSQGYVKLHTTTIEVERNPNAPQVYIDAAPLKGTAPYKVHFKGVSFSEADISKYEWDFDGDGVFDVSSSESDEIVATYGMPGTYEAEFRVTSSEGLSSSEKVSIEISDPQALNIEVIISDDEGIVPLEVDFNAAIESKDAIQKYQWDFQGDGIFDFTSSASPVAKYVYHEPGLYTPTLRVVDEKNIAAESEKKVRFRVPNINRVKASRLTVKPPKGKAPFTPIFSFKSDFEAEDISYFWDFDGDGVCDIVTSAPEIEFTYEDAGIYIAEVRVKDAGDIIAARRKMVYVTKGKRNNREPVVFNSTGLKEKKAISRDKSDRIELSDRTGLIMPAGILEEDDIVNIKRLDEDEISKQIILEGENGLIPIGEYREYKFENHKGVFEEEMTISIPYSDKDNDGIVDERDVDELTLEAYWFDENIDEWKILSDTTLFPKENLITVNTSHFSIFGIAGKKINIADDFSGNDEAEERLDCFIATASFGTPFTPEVRTLCDFRDRYLLKSAIGQRIVTLYYRFSPPIAGYIKNKPFHRALVRACLKPLVYFLRVAHL